MTSEQAVVFQTLGTASGKLIGIATLNMEKALNALNLDMVRALTNQLMAWQQDSEVVCVVLDGAGDKAFCAGGDVRAIYKQSIANPGEIASEAETFFSEEYQLDYLIHEFGKPFLVWGHGFVMGGGVGLMAGASHRVVTETSRIAMPEITIGLYPDVGGSYFLNRMPGKSGLFLGLTAYQMNAADACYVGLGNHYLNNDDKQVMFDAMATLDWSDNVARNHLWLDEMLNELSIRSTIAKGESTLANNQGLIDSLMAGSLDDIIVRANKLETDEKWLSRAIGALIAGSPISAQLVYQQTQLDSKLSLADIYRWELIASVNSCAHGDFCEGVRALLIDKDRNPKWKYSSHDEIPASLMEKITTMPWEIHPLQQLGQ
ncbi:enoyl-CoA hydratase/isomerase family protein [Parashewanella tropica]|uniref:enoyl-CoA hydratase/isomerase family protein n=1 Tax=Parashewanella tropica TaxID=2547970 RepID=UPI001059BD5A|nr:enoyl-CoA hydratase/isomerase family protein [Parashewanella tropica]